MAIDTQTAYMPTVQARVDQDLFDKLAELAAKNERSLAAETRVALRQHVEKIEDRDASTPDPHDHMEETHAVPTE